MDVLYPYIILAPAAGLLANLLAGRRLGDPGAGIAGSLAAGTAFGLAVWQFLLLRLHPEGAVVSLGEWIRIGALEIPWAFRVDTLSVTMALVVTGVGTLIHIYAIGYMHGDPGFARFFVYLNLFLVAMLVLVGADNYAVLFVGWEGVGLCSYLLIGFWFDRGEGGTANATAGRKAFVVNRIGDLGLLIAMFLMYRTFGTLDFDGVFGGAEAALIAGAPVAVAIALALLVGAAGKSAQIPLFVWLPDAMAGPTPVSALIHAATMVTAGVYLIVRSHVLFELAPMAQAATVATGAATALLAATAAVAQFDIKRVLAYSTISQLGFMVAAAGLGAYTAAIFHLVTHAFFKALLFLAAGSVIHGLEHGGAGHQEPGTRHSQDMRTMGGLRRRMPVTFAVYTAGALALAGLPPLSGFFSKDEILVAAYAHGPLVFGTLCAAAFLTAFYMGRQIFLVFTGSPRSPEAADAAESGRVMTAPLIGLALLAVFGGVLNLPGTAALGEWLSHAIGHGEHPAFSLPIAIGATGLAVAGGWLAGRLYRSAPEAGPDPLKVRLGGLFAFLSRAWRLDDLYAAWIVGPFKRLAAVLDAGEIKVISLPERLLAGLTVRAGRGLSLLHTGQLNWNMAGIVAGFIALLLAIGWMR
ncbi:MAG TPA: NADH-quinone oxidoreductase subunit L [Anaerolineales bacterium]|nr:NADH-quinone oxidoreductase subunit L [Anaerolineales bacterium]